MEKSTSNRLHSLAVAFAASALVLVGVVSAQQGEDLPATVMSNVAEILGQ